MKAHSKIFGGSTSNVYEDNEIKITDAKVVEHIEANDMSDIKGKVFSEKLTKDKLIELMGWNEIPKLAKKSYTYDMRKILGQLTPKELKNMAKRELKELKIKRGEAKMRKLLAKVI